MILKSDLVLVTGRDKNCLGARMAAVIDVYISSHRATAAGLQQHAMSGRLLFAVILLVRDQDSKHSTTAAAVICVILVSWYSGWIDRCTGASCKACVLLKG